MKHASFRWMVLLVGVLAMTQAGCRPSSPKWSEDYAGEMKKAAAEGSLVLVLVDGPGWNAPSDELHRGVLRAPEFIDFVKENHLRLVEAVIPNPRGKGVKQDEANRLQEIIVKSGVHGYPTLALFDSAGYAFVSFSSTDLKQVISTLRSGVEQQNKFAETMAEAETLQGDERVQKLMSARELLPEERRDAYPGLIDTIIKNDPEDKTGFQKRIADAQQFQEQMTLFNKQLAEQLGDVSKLKPQESLKMWRESVLELLKKDVWAPMVRQFIYQSIVVSYFRENKPKEALPYLLKAADAYPESPQSEIMRREYDRLTAELEKESAEREVPARSAESPAEQPDVQ